MFDAAGVATAVDQAASEHAPASEAHTDTHADSPTRDGPATAVADAAASAYQELRAADPARNDGKREVVFIESNVKDYQLLVNGVKTGAEVVLLDATQDGLAQMAQWAKIHSGYDAIHILGHGAEGQVNLGTLTLDSASALTRPSDLATLGSALTETGDLLLYGCEVASGEGQAFIAEIATRTGSDVAASDDATGAARFGGDWTLERSTGTIETTALADDHYDSVLAPPILDLNGATGGTDNTVTLANASTGLATADAEVSSSAGWDGGSLTIQRVKTGGVADASANDVFSFTTSSDFTTSGGNLQTTGGTPTTFATYTNTGGVLTITFNASATSALVQAVTRHIGYSNSTPYGNAAIRFALNDGSTTANADVTVTSTTLYVDATTYDADGDAADGFNLAEALAVARSGDTVHILNGTYRGQFVAAYGGVTIEGQSTAGVILEAPDSASLVASSQAGLSSRGRYAILDLLTTETDTIMVKNITIDGRHQGPSAANMTDLLGIAVYNTNATIDGVTIRNIADALDSDDVLSGISDNFGILAEAGLGVPRTVTIRNSTISEFQKTGITAWGRGLTVEIEDNTITLAGDRAPSVQNGMQIGSSTSNRDGVLATIRGNTITNAASPNNTYAVTGVLMVGAGQSTVENNQITGAPTAPTADGGRLGIGLLSVTGAITIQNNTIEHTDAALYVQSASTTLTHIISGNTLNGNTYQFAGQTSPSINTLNITVASTGTPDNISDCFIYYMLGGNDQFTDTGSVNSQISGGDGDDSITAGSGNDTLIGEGGNDTMAGGAGADVFIIGNGDTITDLTALQDRLRITAAVVPVTRMTLADSGADAILSIDTDGVGGADLVITLTGKAGLTVSRLYATDDGTDTDIILDAAPTINGLAGDSVTWAGVGNTVTLDAGTAVTVGDVENDVGDWNNGTLTIQRVTTGGVADASSHDLFDFSVVGADFTVNGGNLQTTGGSPLTFASFTNTGGVLSITFNGGATSALIQNVMQRITYRNDTPYGDAVIRFALSDGIRTTNADVTVTSTTIYVDTTNDDGDSDAADGFSLREALARSVAQSGADTIVFASGVTGTITLSGSMATLGVGDTLDFSRDGTNSLVIASATGGELWLGQDSTILTGSDDTLNISAALSGSSGLIKIGTGTLTLSGTSTYNGSTTVSAGTLLVTGALGATSSLSVEAGATLGGTGSIFATGSSNTLTVLDDATLAPGVAGTNNGIGKLTINGNLGISGGLALEVSDNGGVGGIDFDQVVVNGIVSLNGGSLTVSRVGSYTGAAAATYRVIDNDLSDVVTGAAGTFGNIAEGSDVTFDDGAYTVSYLAGTGNDVVLTVVPNPTVSSVSSSTADGWYKVGDVITITVTFSRSVAVTGVPTLALGVGRSASYTGGSGSSTLSFSYTVQAGDTAGDLDYATASALTLNGGTIVDSVTHLNAQLTLATPGAAHSLGANKALVIDTTAPTVTGVTSSTADGLYKAGDTVSIQVSFGEAVTVVGVPVLSLGNNGRTATYTGGSGSGTLTFSYTVQAGDTAADLEYASTAALSGTIRDAAGNDGVLTLASPGASGSLGNAKAIVIDAVAPTVTGVTSSTANGTYKAGDTISIQVSFGEAVTVVGVPVLSLGNNGRTATYTGGSGSGTLTFSYTVQAGDTAADLEYASTAALSGTIRDAAGNDAALALASPGASGSLGNAKAIVIDAVAPTVARVTSSTANGTYKAGDTISIQVNVSEAVTVVGVPVLALGHNGRTATYTGGSGTRTLTFSYTVQAGDTTADLDYASTAALSGTIRDAAGNDGVLTLAAPGGEDSLGKAKDIVIDTTAPTVSYVNAGTPDGRYKVGDVLSLQVGFSEAVTVAGTPLLTLATGRTASYVGGSGGRVLTFTYTVQAGDTAADLDYASTTALSGTIRDAVGNDAVLTLATPGAVGSLSNAKDIVLDAVPPVVTGVSVPTDATYGAGETLTFTVTFDKAVLVTGTPSLPIALDDGRVIQAGYVSGSGGQTLTFRHTVAAGEQDIDGIVLARVLALTQGTILDRTGNAATGALNGVAGTGGVRIDSLAPTVTGVTSATANGTHTTGAEVSIQVTFSEAVTVTGTPVLALGIGGRTATYTGGSGGTTLTFRYTVQAGDTAADLDYASAGALTGGRIADAAGNVSAAVLPAAGAAGSLGANKDIVIDTTAPEVRSVAVPTDGTYGVGSVLSFFVEMSEAVSVSNGTPTIVLTVGGVRREAVYVPGGGTGTLLRFDYTVQAGDSDADGIEVSGLSLNGARIADRAGLTVGTTLNGVSSPQGVRVDTTPPSVPSQPRLAGGSDSGVSASDSITNVSRPILTGTATANGTVTVFVDGTAVGTAPVDAAGNWSFSVPTALAEGGHTVQTRVTDRFGTAGQQASPPLSLTVDTTGPSIGAGGALPVLSTANRTVGLGGGVSLDNAGPLGQAVITLTDPHPDDELVIGTLPAGITAARSGNTIILSGAGSAADYQAALQAIGLRSTASDPAFTGTATSRTITVSVQDPAGNASGTAAMRVTVQETVTLPPPVTPTVTAPVVAQNGPSSNTGGTGGTGALPSLPGGGTGNGDGGAAGAFGATGTTTDSNAGRSITLSSVGNSSSSDAGRSITLGSVGNTSSSSDAGRSITLSSVSGSGSGGGTGSSSSSSGLSGGIGISGSSGGSALGGGLGGAGLGGGGGFGGGGFGGGLGGGLGGGGGFGGGGLGAGGLVAGGLGGLAGGPGANTAGGAAVGGSAAGTGTGAASGTGTTGAGATGTGGPRGTGPQGLAPAFGAQPGSPAPTGPTPGTPLTGTPQPGGRPGPAGPAVVPTGEGVVPSNDQPQGQPPQGEAPSPDGSSPDGAPPADGAAAPAPRAEAAPPERSVPGFAQQVAMVHGGRSMGAALLAALSTHVLPQNRAA